MKFLISTILGLCLSATGFGQSFEFTYHKIGQFGQRMGQTSLIDIDKDGDLDFVFGLRGHLHWYEYQTGSQWMLHELGQGAITDVGGCALDVNQDGWMDFVVGDSWYEHPGSDFGKGFLLHKKNMISSHDNVAVDVNGDGHRDIVSVSNDPDHPVLCWYEIKGDYRDNWDYHKIGRGIHGGVGPKGFGDLDNDGDMDIVCGDAWYENLDFKGLKWERHHVLVPEGGSRPDKYGLALKSWCHDLNGDGRLDIVQAEADTQDGRIFWWKNLENSSSFEFNLISDDTTNQDFHSLIVADFDGDQDVDIVSGGGPLSVDDPKLFIWENVVGNGAQWKEHLILEGKEVHEIVGGDVDADGDIDICAKPWQGDLHFYLENRSIK